MGPAILALTDIISDPYPGHSVIPSICRATYDRRLLPGETAERCAGGDHLAAGGRIHAVERDDRRGRVSHVHGELMRCEKFFPAWMLAEDHWLVQRALDGLRGAGLAPELRAYRFCTNAAYSAGVAGVPTIGFGPARESDAHMIDEKLQVDDLRAAASGYRGMIEAILGV